MHREILRNMTKELKNIPYALYKGCSTPAYQPDLAPDAMSSSPWGFSWIYREPCSHDPTPDRAHRVIWALIQCMGPGRGGTDPDPGARGQQGPGAQNPGLDPRAQGWAGAAQDPIPHEVH